MLRRADMALGGDGAIGLPYWDWSEAEVKGEVRQQRRDEFTLCSHSVLRAACCVCCGLCAVCGRCGVVCDVLRFVVLARTAAAVLIQVFLSFYLSFYTYLSLLLPQVLPGIIRKRLHGEFADDFFPTPPHRLAKLSDTQSDSSIKRSLEGARVAELAQACLTSVNHGQHACTRFSSARSPSLEQSHNSM